MLERVPSFLFRCRKNARKLPPGSDRLRDQINEWLLVLFSETCLPHVCFPLAVHTAMFRPGLMATQEYQRTSDALLANARFFATNDRAMFRSISELRFKNAFLRKPVHLVVLGHLCTLLIVLVACSLASNSVVIGFACLTGILVLTSLFMGRFLGGGCIGHESRGVCTR